MPNSQRKRLRFSRSTVRVSRLSQHTTQAANQNNISSSLKSPWLWTGVVCVIALTVLCVTLLTRSRQTALAETPKPTLTAGVHVLLPPESLEPTATEDPILDLSEGSRLLEFAEARINEPTVFGRKLLFSAGSGSLNAAVLKTLYLYDLDTSESKKISSATVEGGEIYETLMNDRWITWVDTDQMGTNYICLYNRETGEEMQLKECRNGVPKLRLWDDTMIWMEQTDVAEDKLYLIDLQTFENIPLETFVNSTTYGLSAPYIDRNMVVWAAPDPGQSEEERAEDEKSIIKMLDLNTIEEDINPVVYVPDSYVHEPITNGKAIAWLTGNKSPNSHLMLTVDKERLIDVATGVMRYGFGENFLVFGRESRIWAYFWETDQYALLTAPDQKGILPAVYGNTVVWFDTTDSEAKSDQLRVLTLQPDTSPVATPAPNTPRPTMAPTFSPEPLVIVPLPGDDEEDITGGNGDGTGDNSIETTSTPTPTPLPSGVTPEPSPTQSPTGPLITLAPTATPTPTPTPKPS